MTCLTVTSNSRPSTLHYISRSVYFPARFAITCGNSLFIGKLFPTWWRLTRLYCCSSIREKVPAKSVVTIRMQNIMMQLRKCCNHPYLLEYPLTESEDYRIDEDLVQTCGKMKLLDAMLAELKLREHKVGDVFLMYHFTCKCQLLCLWYI